MINKEIEDGIIIATFTGSKSNSINAETIEHLNAIVDEVEAKEELKGIVLTGEGKFFSSGFDMPMFLNFKDHAEVVDFFSKEEEALLKFFTCEKPTVAAINGHAAAAGLFMAVACDYRIAKNHPKIRLGMSEIKLGLGLPLVAGGVLKYGFDNEIALRNMLYFGQFFGVERAKEIGAVDEIVEEDVLISRAKEIVSQWIDTPNRPFIPMKKLLKGYEAKIMRENLETENWQDGLKCLLDENVRNVLKLAQAALDAKS